MKNKNKNFMKMNNQILNKQQLILSLQRIIQKKKIPIYPLKKI